MVVSFRNGLNRNSVSIETDRLHVAMVVEAINHRGRAVVVQAQGRLERR